MVSERHAPRTRCGVPIPQPGGSTAMETLLDLDLLRATLGAARDLVALSAAAACSAAMLYAFGLLSFRLVRSSRRALRHARRAEKARRAASASRLALAERHGDG